MSWDLHPEEMLDKASSLPVTQTPEVGVFHNFMQGAAKVAMQGLAKTARAVDIAGSIGPIVQDALASNRVNTVTTAQDRYFKEHDQVFQAAVDYWTPRPNEVGVAGEVAGSLLSMLPTIMASPALAVGATQLSQAQDLVQQGVSQGKAQAVGAVQALGLGAGIWMPILGTNAVQRILIGGAGFNVVQGVATRAASKAILGDDKAAEQFRPLGGTELTLDILLGLAFGGYAHINPAMRAQGAKAWEDIGNFLKDAPPSDKAALATLREAQHINADSLPGTPVSAADLDVHVQRMRQAIDDMANDRPINVEPIVKDVQPIQPDQIITPETVGESPAPIRAGAPGSVFAPPDTQPKYNPDLARIEQDQAIREAIQEHARTVAAEEGIPQIPDRKTIAQTIEEQLVQAGRPAEEAKAGATLWQAFFDTTASRYGRTGQELFDRYMKGITKQSGEGPMLAQGPKAIADAYNGILNKIGRDELNGILGDWNGAELNEAGDRIIGYPGRDRAFSRGKDGGKVNITKKEFLNWLMSDAAVDPKVYGDSPEWRAKIDAAREASGMLAQPGKLFQGAVPWYHSELERQIGTAKMGAASPKDWKNYIKGLSNKGVKADEVKWTGLEEWLDLQQGKVTKEQIQQYMKDGGVKVEEVELGKPLDADPEIAAKRERLTVLSEKADRLERKDEMLSDAERAELDQLVVDSRDWGRNPYLQPDAEKQVTKFHQYQLPGGENYRELLLTLPEKVQARTPDAIMQDLQERGYGAYEDGGVWWLSDANDDPVTRTSAPSEVQRIMQELDGAGDAITTKNPASFHSAHFDPPNILSHIRFNERTDADGKKVLFIEEIQSDWAQKGKKEGFTETTGGVFGGQVQAKPGTVPKAPFVGKTEAWVGLSLKRMIRYAAENGFDRVAWTNGEQQAARYDLSKQINRLEYKTLSNGNYVVSARRSGNGESTSFTNAEGVDANRLEELVGKDMAKKIVAGEGEPGERSGWKQMSGLDLKVGGEGMKAFYDRIVPNVANDVLKKLGGGRVGEVRFGEKKAGQLEKGWTTEQNEEGLWDIMDPQGNVMEVEFNEQAARRAIADFERGETVAVGDAKGLMPTQQPGFDITPSMREKAMETQALFQPERGALQFDQQGKMAIALLKSADPSTFLHESGHFFLEVTNDLASQPDAPAGMKQDMQTLYNWWNVKDADTWNNMTLDEKRPYHEQFARGFERYLRDGQAPTSALKSLFQRFRDWLKAVYESATQLNVEVSPEVRAVMDRMLANRTEAPPKDASSATPPPPRGGIGDTAGEASVLTEVQQVREDIMAAESTARARWGDSIVDALYQKYADYFEDAGQLRGMQAVMESLAEDAKPAYLMKVMGPRPKEPQSLVAAIKELGGINTSMRSDIAGPDKKGVPVGLFRKTGKNVDELALLLQEKGFLNEGDMANEADNGGINKLMEMIQDEMGGNKHYSAKDEAQVAALREHDQFMESMDGKGDSASSMFTPEEWSTIQREVLAEGMVPTAKNVVDADAVAIAMQIDEARVERAAITAADDFDFMAQVRDVINGYENATTPERGTPAGAAEPAQGGAATAEGGGTPTPNRDAGNQRLDPVAQQAMRMVAENPDLLIATGTDGEGNQTYQKASDYLAEAKAMAELKRQDMGLFELAAQCLLGGGR